MPAYDRLYSMVRDRNRNVLLSAAWHAELPQVNRRIVQGRMEGIHDSKRFQVLIGRVSFLEKDLQLCFSHLHGLVGKW